MEQAAATAAMSDSSKEEEERPGSSLEEANGDDSTEGSTGDPVATRVSLRFLVTNTAAGSVIGKAGATISEFQAQSGARIQLSRNHEYFPGTSDRVAVLGGSVKEVLSAFRLILSKIIKDIHTDSNTESKSSQVRLLVPKTVCGAIIGKGGANIKKFVEESQASIKLSSQDQLLPGVSDRIVTVSGNLDQLTKAVTLILGKLTEESSYLDSATTPLVYSVQNLRRNSSLSAVPTIAYGAPSLFPTQGMMTPVIAVQSPYPMALPVVEAGTLTSSVTVAVSDEHIGLILGRAGKTLQEIQQSSGAKIKVSDRGDFVSGTKNRKVTMIGSGEAIQAAQYLLNQKIQQSKATTTTDGETDSAR